MWHLRPRLDDPRLHFLGLAVALILLIVGIAGRRADAPCPSCPGHRESARECLCYHAPAAAPSIAR